MKDVEKNLRSFPEAPGIYKMKNAVGDVIYVGKAKNIKKRVQSYFRKDYEHSTRTRRLIEAVDDIECIQTDTELEALLLETNLIKELRPKYNILMKDDKSYVYVKVDLSEDFPRIRVVREKDIPKGGFRNPKIKLFGPKLASSRVYESLRILKKLFPFRHCNLDLKWKGGDTLSFPRTRESAGSPNKDLVEVTNRVIDFPCLDYFIKRCPGPCIGAINPEEYKKIVQQILDFFSGKTQELEKSLKEQMMAAAEQKLFEKAAKLRDKLFVLRSVSERQKITDLGRRNMDAINYYSELGRVFFNVFMIRNGKLQGSENFVLDALEMKAEDMPRDSAEILESFLLQYYAKVAEPPAEILIPHAIEGMEAFEKWLKASMTVPERGEKNQLLLLCHKNAVQFAKQFRIKWMADQRGETAVARLAEVLEMKQILHRIEGFDISHLGGNETVGSMVVFEKGLPKSGDYRHFKLRTVMGKPDDYKSMEEVLMRRLKYLSQAVPDKEIRIRKPAKKDFEVIKKIVQDELLNNENMLSAQFLCAKKKKEICAFGRIVALDVKVFIISNIWVHPSFRGKKLGYKIMEKLIKASKLKKVYVDVQKKFSDYYAVFGFVPLINPPEVLVKHAHDLDEKLKSEGREVPSTKDLVFMVYEAKKRKAIDPSFSSKPDLLVIDGGKGQLGSALLALKRLNLQIPVISLAKRLEEIYFPNEKAPLLLEEGDEALKLLQRIRDESHRFAITFQREFHRKALLK